MPQDVARRTLAAYNEAMSQEPPIPKELWDLIPAAAQAALLALLATLQRELTALRQQVADLTARSPLPATHPPSSALPRVNPPDAAGALNRDTSLTAAPCCPRMKKSLASPAPAAAAAWPSRAPTRNHCAIR